MHGRRGQQAGDGIAECCLTLARVGSRLSARVLIWKPSALACCMPLVAAVNRGLPRAPRADASAMRRTSAAVSFGCAACATAAAGYSTAARTHSAAVDAYMTVSR